MKSLYVLLLLILSFSMILLPATTNALTSYDKEVIYNGLEWLPDIGTSNTFCDAGGGVVSLIGSNNSEKVYSYFRSRGLSEVQSAAIVGNFMVETRATMDPTIKQGSLVGGKIQTFSDISEVENSNGKLGYGLAQWTYPTRQDAWVAFTVNKGWNILELESQLEWVWEEWPSHPDYGKEEFLETSDLRQATWIFVSFYERPASVAGYEESLTQPSSGDAKESLDTRFLYAQEALAQFGNNPVSGIDSPSLCLTGTNNTDFGATGVRIDRSPPWIGKINVDPESNCTPGFTEGANTLQQFVLEAWQPPVTGVGGYNCRTIRGNNTLTSIHGVGRALDIYVDATDPAELLVGDRIRNWMIANSVELGVQRVIWNRFSWNSQKDGWNDYCRGGCVDEGGSKSPHTDHLHIEINEDGANKTLPWYAGR